MLVASSNGSRHPSSSCWCWCCCMAPVASLGHALLSANIVRNKKQIAQLEGLLGNSHARWQCRHNLKRML